MDFRSDHEFLGFMRSLQGAMAQEYERVRKRVLEDPGTAGDQVEETWATILRNWLPANYPIVTKGRIIDHEGNTSPQVDILVLHPSYPVALRNQKLYFAGGVVAAFECKLTLRGVHLKKAFETAARVKSLVPERSGNLYDELHQPIIFGVLAHAHDWEPSQESRTGRMMESLYSQTHKVLDSLAIEAPELYHPRYLIDVLCTANAATFVYGKTILLEPIPNEMLRKHLQDYRAVAGADYEGVVTIYRAYEDGDDSNFNSLGEPLVALVSYLMQRLAYEDASLRSLAEYFQMIHMGASIGTTIEWTADVFSEEVLSQLSIGRYDDQLWRKWDRYFY